MKNSRQQDDRADERGHDRPHQDVAVDDVRHLVADHALELDPVHRRRAAPGSPRSTSARGRGRSRTRSAPARGPRRRVGFGIPAAIDSPSTMLCRRGSSCGVTVARARRGEHDPVARPKYDPSDRTTASATATTSPPSRSRTRVPEHVARPRRSEQDRPDDEQDGLALVRRDLLVHRLPGEARPGTGPRAGSSMSKNSRGREPERRWRRRSRGTSRMQRVQRQTWSL